MQVEEKQYCCEGCYPSVVRVILYIPSGVFSVLKVFVLPDVTPDPKDSKLPSLFKATPS
jgi:hypothetical protein